MSEFPGDLGRSWNGTPPEVPNYLIPTDLPNFSYPNDYAAKFNADPLTMLIEAIKTDSNNAHLQNLGPYLFYCKGIYPSTVSKLIFSPQFPFDLKSFLYFYFNSIIHDFTSLSDSVYYCFSRIAFPDNKDEIQLILDMFSGIYLTCNPSFEYDIPTLSNLLKALLIQSGFNVPGKKFPKSKYLELTNNNKIPRPFRERVFDDLENRPFPVFFTFTNFNKPPEYEKRGMLKKIGGLFKTKKDRCFAIDGFVLKYYNDNTMKGLIGELDIPGTISSYEPAQKKEPEHLLIRKKDGGSLGYKISKEGVRKKSNHSDYIAYSDQTDITSWANNLNLIAFWKLVYDLIQ